MSNCANRALAKIFPTSQLYTHTLVIMSPKADSATERKAADIFDRYVADPQVASAEETAQQLAATAESLLSDKSTQEDAAWVGHIIYDHILLRVQKTVHDNPIHERAIDILQSLKNVQSDQVKWSTLEPFGMQVRETWNGSYGDYGVDGWASLNAFVARVNQKQIAPGRFDLYGIWAMRSAVEQKELVEGELPAACTWIVYSADRMRKLTEEEALEERAAKGGPKWTGRAGYSMERWKLWKEELENVSKKGKLAASTQKLVERALSLM